MKPTDPFPGLIHAFFYERLVQQRNVSAHTVRSYRDAWSLFLRFGAARHKRSVAQITLAELTATEVAAFLQDSEDERKVSIGTRNCRLAALRSFFSLVAEREPAAMAQCVAVLHIPTKKASKPAPSYLDSSEVEAILDQPDRNCLEGQRDHALLSFLYNTGARILGKRSMFVPPRSVSMHRYACACWARGARSASARCGQKPSPYFRRYSNDNHAQAMKPCS